MSSPIPIGLIGTGGRLRGIVRHICELEPRVRIVAAHDPLEHSRTALRKQLGYDYRIAESEESLVNDPSLEWVLIGSWNAQHARHAIAALEAGKNVFCEKPLATTLEDCLAIRDAAERSGKLFVFGLVLRYSPHYQRLHEIVASGAIGRILSFEFNETLGFNHGGYIFGNWRRKREYAGTHLLEKCCHDLDLANWITGSLPVKAASFGGRDFFLPENAGRVEKIGPGPNGETAYSSWPDPQHTDPFGGDTDLFDNQVAILQYANGIRGTFHTNANTAIYERRFYLCGTEGTIRADLITGHIECCRIGWNAEKEVIDTKNAGGHGGGDEVMAEALARTLVHGGTPLTSIGHGLRSAIAAFGIDQAADEGRVVDLAPLWCRAGIDPAKG